MHFPLDPERYIKQNTHLLSGDFPRMISPQLSYHKYHQARQAIKTMFSYEDMRGKSTILGTSSGDYRSHQLYCSNEGVLYVLYDWCNNYKGIDYFTKDMMNEYFNECMDEAPEFVEADCVKEYLKKENQYMEIVFISRV